MKTPEIEVPWKKIFPVLTDIVGVRSANYHEPGVVHTIPAGSRVRLDNVHDETSITVCLMDEKGEATSLKICDCPTYPTVFRDGQPVEPDPEPCSLHRRHYRFDVPNAALSVAIGIPLPEKQRDVVAELMRYEQGDATPQQERSLFAHLRKTGLGRKLQGHYSSRM